jgi:hypothetical protein
MSQNEITNQLNQCFGSLSLFYNPFFKALKYTEGVKLMSELCSANWMLVDVLANCTLLSKEEGFITIRVFKDENADSCHIDFTDGDYTLLKRLEYSYTDFPLTDQIDKSSDPDGKKRPALTMYCIDSVILLTSEY